MIFQVLSDPVSGSVARSRCFVPIAGWGCGRRSVVCISQRSSLCLFNCCWFLLFNIEVVDDIVVALIATLIMGNAIVGVLHRYDPHC